MDNDQEITKLIKKVVKLYKEAGKHLQQNDEAHYLNIITSTGLHISRLRALMGETLEFSDHWLDIQKEFEAHNDQLSIGYLYKLHGDLMEDMSKDLASMTLTARIYFLAGKYLESEKNFSEAAYSYLKARNFYTKIQDWDGADTSYLKHLICNRKVLPQNSLSFIKAGIFELTTGYGYMPSRLFMSSLVIITVFAIIFNIFDIIGWGGTGSQSSFFDYLYFSGITFLTVGYGDIVPVSTPAKAISVFEGFIGLGSYSLFVAMMARRLFKF